MFKLDKRNLLIIPSPMIVMCWLSSPQRAFSEGLTQECDTCDECLHHSQRTNEIKSLTTGKHVNDCKYFNVQSCHFADTRCTQKRENTDWTPAACPWSGGKSSFFSEEVTIAFIEGAQREENGNRRMHLKALRDTTRCDDPVDGHGYEQHILQGGTKIWEKKHHTGEWDEARVLGDRTGQV